MVPVQLDWRSSPRQRQSTRRCADHNEFLQEHDFLGHRFTVPVCLSCLPPHAETCAQARWLERVAFRYTLDLQHRGQGAFDLRDNCDPNEEVRRDWLAFTHMFGETETPACTCAERKAALKAPRPNDEPDGPRQVFRLRWGGWRSPWLAEARALRAVTQLREEQPRAYVIVERGEMERHHVRQLGHQVLDLAAPPVR